MHTPINRIKHKKIATIYNESSAINFRDRGEVIAANKQYKSKRDPFNRSRTTGHISGTAFKFRGRSSRRVLVRKGSRTGHRLNLKHNRRFSGNNEVLHINSRRGSLGRPRWNDPRRMEKLRTMSFAWRSDITVWWGFRSGCCWYANKNGGWFRTNCSRPVDGMLRYYSDTEVM